MLTGFFNAIYDTQVLGHTNIYCIFTIYLSPGQYILGDAMYTPTKYIILSYKAPKANYLKNHSFNK